jgi:hypothetical protein
MTIAGPGMEERGYQRCARRKRPQRCTQGQRHGAHRDLGFGETRRRTTAAPNPNSLISRIAEKRRQAEQSESEGLRIRATTSVEAQLSTWVAHLSAPVHATPCSKARSTARLSCAPG